jgi:hypothetical protein
VEERKTHISACCLLCGERLKVHEHINFYHLPQDLAHEMFQEILP